jgi:hypothetical protein
MIASKFTKTISITAEQEAILLAALKLYRDNRNVLASTTHNRAVRAEATKQHNLTGDITELIEPTVY